MKFEKLRYSKCPNCKKYGIGAMRGVGRATTYVETCRYCGKKYRINWALAFLLSVFIAFFIGIVGLIINTYIMKIPTPILWPVCIISYYLVFHFCPMEEEKDK